ncbi:MAG: transposase [Anaerolineales bacterium]
MTICTKQLKPYLGKIGEGLLILNELGQTTYQYWSEIPQHHTYVTIDEIIVMPNHIHGILILAETLPVETPPAAETLPVETLHATSLPSSTMSSISPRRGSLGVIIRSFKSAVTRWARKNGHPNFAWQPRFYDHIIRNEDALSRIRFYIQINPMKWEHDKYFR